jgi:hypothetical protein
MDHLNQPVPLDDLNCPLLGSQEGSTCSPSVTRNVIGLLQETQPLFLLAGHQCIFVHFSSQKQVCNMPVVGL